MGITPKSVIALDVGSKRIGVAAASLAARLPRPVTTLQRQSENLFDELASIITAENATALVVGLPRGLDGQTTEQTRATEAFVQELKQHVALPIDMQDEAVTSRQAQAELETAGKPYAKGDIDALAATYILSDWLADHKDMEA
jgi:putative Holliday junction resolvase